MKVASVFVGVGILVLLGGWLILSSKSADPEVLPQDTGDTMHSSLSLTSSAFKEGESIPSQYTCDGDNVSPPLSISGVPEGTISLVLTMDDPDIPQVFKDERGIDSFDHWVLYGISPETHEIPEGALSGAAGLNGAGEPKYTGPCPPPQYEPSEHRYFFRLYALSSSLNFIKAPTKAEVLTAIEGSVIAEVELMARYKRTGR